MSQHGLASVFLASYLTRQSSEGAPPVTASEAALEERLVAILEDAEKAYPGWRLERVAFASRLGQVVRPAKDLLRGLETVSGKDLYLAWACLQGNAEALATVERMLPDESTIATWTRLPLYDAKEVRQRASISALVGGSVAPATLASYSGFGTLAKWLRSIVFLTASKVRREHARSKLEPRGAKELEGLVACGEDPELAYISARYGHDMDQALRTAFSTLSARDKTLLRLHFARGLGITALGRMYQVHRATAARWIIEARNRFESSARATLAERLSLAPSSADSLWRLLASRCELSLTMDDLPSRSEE